MSGALHHSKGSFGVVELGPEGENPTLDAENAIPENAYRSAMTVTPSFKSFSIVDLVARVGQGLLSPESWPHSRKLPTIGRK